jgi:hypothetical protein
VTLCRHCLIDYTSEQVFGVSGDANQLRELARSADAEFTPTLAGFRKLLEGQEAAVQVELWSAVQLPPKKSKPLFGLFGKASRDEADIAQLIATKWDPYCPQLHLIVDALAEKPFFITVAGEVGASKSTFLLGMVAEMLQKARLGPFEELLPTVRPSQLDEVRAQIKSVYTDGELLPATTADEVKDGFVIRIASEGEIDPLNLGFIDVPGEVIRDEAKAAKSARFIYRTEGIVLLLDPRAFPREGSFMVSSTEGVNVVSPDIINALSEGLTKVRGRSPAELGIPLVVPINALKLESAEIRRFLRDRDMDAIVRTAEVNFGSGNVYYTRLSAIGADKKGAPRQPQGCWKPVALILSHAGYLDEPHA